jgi:hypothetical protein
MANRSMAQSCYMKRTPKRCSTSIVKCSVGRKATVVCQTHLKTRRLLQACFRFVGRLQCQSVRRVRTRERERERSRLTGLDCTQDILAQTSTWTLPQYSQALAPILTRLCARYLLHEKRRKLALDSVANFHLRNGAQLYRINALADTSKNGMQCSHGMMVNYLYDFACVKENNARYLLGEPIARSPQVQAIIDSVGSMESES